MSENEKCLDNICEKRGFISKGKEENKIKTRIESEGESIRTTEIKGGGNDPCIERLGSPTGILARMVHWLQTC